MMLVFSTVDARRSPESMKFPVFSLLAGNFGFRDGFARDCLLQGRVRCEPRSDCVKSRIEQAVLRKFPSVLCRGGFFRGGVLRTGGGRGGTIRPSASHLREKTFCHALRS